MNQYSNQLATAPIKPSRSKRVEEKRILTSGNAGKIIPISVTPLLREDALQSGRMRISFEMMETAEMLMNGVNVSVNAYLVPFLAFERFNGMDSLNRAYAGQPEREGLDPVPFFFPHQSPVDTSTAEFYRTLGIHAPAGASVNTAYLEAYNTMVNFRRKQRSQHLTMRALYDTTLAEAFWHHTAMKHIVPDFDQALVDGEVALNVANALMPVKGLGLHTGAPAPTDTPDASVIESGFSYEGEPATYNAWTGTNVAGAFAIKRNLASGAPQVFAELQDNGISVSLSNIDAAKQTAAFARLRQQFQGHDDEYIIDLLMSGVRIPEQAMSQPILLAQKNTLFGYNQRYASDGANLDKSVTRGETFVDLNLRVPPVNTGGVIVITAEITPEQLFERQRDYFLVNNEVAKLPEYVRDYLDPEKVAVVPNVHIDTSHNDPDATFGYAPLNHEWVRKAPNIGGKYYRPSANTAFDEDRQKIWAVETENPTLTEDFYLCTQMHQKVFADTEADAFEIMASGRMNITGNTVFGPVLHEASDDYDKVSADVPQDRVQK